MPSTAGATIVLTWSQSDGAENLWSSRLRILPPVTPTPEQLKLIGDVAPGFRIIRGAAGTGKTTTALLCLRQLAEVRLSRRKRYGHTAPVRVLVLTFNRTLEGYITELARRSMANDDALEIEVSTFGRWARSLLGPITIADREQTSGMLRTHLQTSTEAEQLEFFVDEIEYVLGRFEPDKLEDYLTMNREGRGRSPRVDRRRRETIIREIIPAYIAAKAKRGVIDWNDVALRAADAKPDLKYDVVVVDEAQDFSANQIRAVLSHLQELHNTTFVLDAVQRIYPQYFKWAEIGIQARPEIIHTLKENYRNTGAIAAFALPLVEGLPQEDDGTLPDFSTCHLPGSKPLVVAGKFSGQINFMLDRLTPTIGKGIESVAILHPRGGGWFNETRRVLRHRNILFCELTRRSDWPSGPEVVALSTIHSAKGLEFDHVLVPGLSQEVTPHGPTDGDADRDRLRRMLAMAIGRASKSVMIGYKPGEESSLIELLDSPTYELIEV